MSEEDVKKNWFQEKVFGIMVICIGALIVWLVDDIRGDNKALHVDLKESNVVAREERNLIRSDINSIKNIQETRRDKVINLLSEHNTKIELNSERIRNLEKTVYK